MSQRNVVALGHVAVVVCCGQAKSHEVALHRVKSVGFSVDAYGACSGKFGLHLLKDFISVDADIGRRNINREVCTYYGVSICRVATFRAIAFAHKARLAWDAFQKAEQAVDFVILEHLRQGIHMQTVIFKRI